MFKKTTTIRFLTPVLALSALIHCASANLITDARDGNLAGVQQRIQKLEKKQDIDAANTDSKSQNVIFEPEFNALHAACYHGRLDVVKLLVESGADIHKMDTHKGSPFLKALAGGNPEVVAYLLQKGADINAMNEVTGNALNFVLQFFNRKKKNEKVFQPIRIALLKVLSPYARGIVNDLNADGLPPLFYTADGDKTAEAEILLKTGAKLTVAEKTYGNSVMHYAAYNQSLKMVKFFAEKGANINAPNKDGRTPLDYANTFLENAKSQSGKLQQNDVLARISGEIVAEAQEIVSYLTSRGAKPGKAK